jgi:hypothetical protein
MRQRKKREEWTGPLPWQLEALLLLPGFGGAAFSIWKIYDTVEGKTSLIANAFGVEFDVVPFLWAMKAPIAVVALIASVKWHMAARKWVCRKLAC